MAIADTDADEASPLPEEPLRPGASSRELELQEFLDRYVIRSLDSDGAAVAITASGDYIRPLSPGLPIGEVLVVHPIIKPPIPNMMK